MQSRTPPKKSVRFADLPSTSQTQPSSRNKATPLFPSAKRSKANAGYHPTAIYTSRVFKFENLPEPRNAWDPPRKGSSESSQQHSYYSTGSMKRESSFIDSTFGCEDDDECRQDRFDDELQFVLGDETRTENIIASGFSSASSSSQSTPLASPTSPPETMAY